MFEFQKSMTATALRNVVSNIKKNRGGLDTKKKEQIYSKTFSAILCASIASNSKSLSFSFPAKSFL